MELDCYQWLEPRLFEEGRRVLEGLVEEMYSFGGSWRKEWLRFIPHKRTEEIFDLVFAEVCNEQGFTKEEVKPFVGDDLHLHMTEQAQIARAITRSRISGILRFFNETTFCGWLSSNYNEIGRYISEFIDVDDDGKPKLSPDFIARLKQRCTHEVPEYARHLCDILRANEKAFAEAIRACNDIKTYCGLDFAFNGDRFSIENFGNFFISHF